MGELSWWHWLLVLVAFMLLFGWKRLPDASRSLGQSLRIFKTEVKGLRDDDDKTPPASAQTTVQQQPALPPVVADGGSPVAGSAQQPAQQVQPAPVPGDAAPRS